MSKSKIHILKCDRCGETANAEYEHHHVFFDWGRIWYANINGVLNLKMSSFPRSYDEMADLCPDCMKELNEWWIK